MQEQIKDPLYSFFSCSLVPFVVNYSYDAAGNVFHTQYVLDTYIQGYYNNVSSSVSNKFKRRFL